jgi:putative endonuclease
MPNLGRLGEELAAREYQRLGFEIIARNYVFPKGVRVGELDLVCRKANLLVFVEVKLRRSDSFGGPLAAVDRSKQRKLVKMAKLFLQAHRQYQALDYQIDVAAVAIDKGQGSVTILSNVIEDFD